MRTKEHINKTMDIIRDTWLKYPELRICQLLSNPFKLDDIYMVEDSSLIKELKECYDKKDEKEEVPNWGWTD